MRWMDGVVSTLGVRGLTLEQARVIANYRYTSMEKVDKWSVIMWLRKWHGTEVQMQDFGVNYGGFLLGV